MTSNRIAIVLLIAAVLGLCSSAVKPVQSLLHQAHNTVQSLSPFARIEQALDSAAQK